MELLPAQPTLLAALASGGRDVFFVLPQVVGDGEPRGVGADENVMRRAYGRVVDEGSHGDVHEGAVTDHRIKEGALTLAGRVVGVLLPEDHRLARPFQMASFERSIHANRSNAEPVVRRQLERWQFAA